ncbi:UvrD-helicase domain-containing protein [Laribacter hongkongensis]|uniref:UvrD-helicase domain-containing protein n=1 Tax=Laribacter hongkongensis TaxID=168471 RepID=UPI001EFD21E2|nr:UvrD-helicase domain-containing protein [Laribacter hongkongensis]MCG8998880.1 UvrD-helicase domain-containing protein [Laribacter hongkongensis]
MNSDFLAGLNPAQLAAVTTRSHALVLAGAGSGKTRVLTSRIAWLLREGLASPASVLAVTFTNKAAREMQTRVGAMLPVNPRMMWIGTFHGLAHRLLRLHHRDAGLPATFTILDSQDQLAAIKRLLKALNLSDDTYPPRQLMQFINRHKEQGLRPDRVQAASAFDGRLIDIWREYERQCRREGVVDFAELLLASFELLTGNEALRAHYQSRFNQILVDEFQDTNRLQYQWLRCLAGPAATLFAVGDDDQSIYAFRGAEIGNMHDFLRDYHITEPVRLEQNYRSTGTILDAANAVIAHNHGRLGKSLWTDDAAGEAIRVYRGWNDADEAEFVAEEVRLRRREGVELSDMAVLYRSNAQSRALEHALFQAGIAYRVVGGLRFFERQEIKHALAYLRLVASPDDDNALLRVINVPARGIGARTVESIQAHAREAGTSLWQAACRTGGRAPASVGRFVQLIESLQGDAARLDFAGLVSHIIDASGLRALYQADKDGADRLENLDELVNAAVGFQPDDPAQTVTEFLTHAALEAGDHEATPGETALTLMTVHAAKGLEFDSVFVTGLEEGLFPHEQSFSDPDGLEEERRLMYVAITRARRRLTLSCAQSRMLHGQSRYPLPSRFLDEIPLPLLAPVNGSPAAPRTAAPVPAAPRPVKTNVILAGGLRIGQTVAHPKFGTGVIVRAEGQPDEARVEVNFTDHGSKWLDLRHARLTPL